MGDYVREIAGYPHGYHPDRPGDGEILAEMRDELARHEAGTETIPDWMTAEAVAGHVASLRRAIAELEAKLQAAT